MVARIAVGLVGGVLAAAVLEFINGVLTFLLPPLIIITPVCVAISLLIALRISRDPTS